LDGERVWYTFDRENPVHPFKQERKNMPETFFIRKTVNIGNTNAFAQGEIDLGAYVDALNKSVLRIHNIQVTYSDATGTSSLIVGNEVGVAQWQLTTQTQSDNIRPDDKSLVSSGRIHMFNDQGTDKLASQVSDVNDVNVQYWTNGYLVATESLYLGGSATTTFVGNVYVTIVMECSVETMSQAKAMALALSQQ
jgi:hypothetical protein